MVPTTATRTPVDTWETITGHWPKHWQLAQGHVLAAVEVGHLTTVTSWVDNVDIQSPSLCLHKPGQAQHCSQVSLSGTHDIK